MGISYAQYLFMERIVLLKLVTWKMECTKQAPIAELRDVFTAQRWFKSGWKECKAAQHMSSALDIVANAVTPFLEPPDGIDTVWEVFVRTMTGHIFTVHVSPFDLVEDLKNQIHDHGRHLKNQQRLVFAGAHLACDDRTLISYNIQENSVIHVLLSLGRAPKSRRYDRHLRRSPIT